MKKIILSAAVFSSLLLSGCNLPQRPLPAAQWQKIEFKDFHFSVESPYPMVDFKFPTKAEYYVKHMMKQNENSAGGEFTVILSADQLKGKINADLKNISDGAMKGLKATYSNLQYSSKPVTCSGLPAMRTDGTGKLLFIFHNHILMLQTYKDDFLYQMIIQYRDDIPAAQEMAERMAQSLALDL